MFETIRSCYKIFNFQIQQVVLVLLTNTYVVGAAVIDVTKTDYTRVNYIDPRIALSILHIATEIKCNVVQKRPIAVELSKQTHVYLKINNSNLDLL